MQVILIDTPNKPNWLDFFCFDETNKLTRLGEVNNPRNMADLKYLFPDCTIRYFPQSLGKLAEKEEIKELV